MQVMFSIPQKISRSRGFTVVELIVAMAVTTVIVSVLVSITSIALESWNRGRSELRSAAQAKAIIDTMAKDLESIVYRRGTTALPQGSATPQPAEWFRATSIATPPGTASFRSSNAIDLVFFSAAADRYNGNIGETNNGNNNDRGGNISLVAYRLNYRSPFSNATGAGASNSLILNRFLQNPDVALSYMGLAALNIEPLAGQLQDPANFVAENIYQFTLVFHVEVIPPAPSGTIPPAPQVIPIIISSSDIASGVDSFSINGSGITVPDSVSGFNPDVIKAGRLMSAEISVTVLSDRAVQQVQQRSFPDAGAKANFINQNSYQYSRMVTLPKL
ncbi:MAG: type II secretion system protein [Verrucomicrobia bacterium]|nr:MAG: type II secretion system protein [Verrucomicrobiota bacterium]